MNKILTPIVITTAATFIISCGSENSSSDANASSQKTTWRLSSLDISHFSENETTVLENAVLYEYDSESELIRIKKQVLQTFEGDLAGQDLSYNQEGFENSTLSPAEIQWPPSEAYHAITEITSISPSHWIEESYQYAPQPDSSEINDSVYLLSGLEFKDWGDSYHEWRIMGADWGGIDTTDVDDTFFGPMNELNGDFSFDQPTTGDEIPTNEADLFPKQHVIREYNSLGYLTYRAIYTEDQSQLLSEDILEYENGTLSEITTYKYILEITSHDGIDGGKFETGYLYTLIGTRKFIFTTNHTLQLYIRGDLNSDIPTSVLTSANYEQAPCGPMTLERSKKAIPRDFPVCIEK